MNNPKKFRIFVELLVIKHQNKKIENTNQTEKWQINCFLEKEWDLFLFFSSSENK
jgi:hypothetical protein